MNITKYFDRIGGRGLRMAHFEGALGVVQHSGESLITGSALGAAHATVGLDYKDKIPADLALGLLAMAFSVTKAGEAIALDARNVGGTALGIFAFRQTFAFMAEKTAAKGGVVKGGFKTLPILKPKTATKMAGEFDVGEDPIVAFAQEL